MMRPGPVMEQGRFEKIEQVFHAAMELPADDRAAFVREQCDGDADAAAQVERMLRFEEQPDVSVAMHRGVAEVIGDTPAVVAPQRDDLLIGREIGDYRIAERLGAGGFGDVYLAEQLRPVQRRVAMKIIRAQLGAERVLARFETERQALAMMDHPNIASIFDAGETDISLGSCPYVVMELVEGSPITAFCDDRTLGPSARIELFLQVCHGVQHAHQKGVIHRDLKPSNVVVTEHEGRPLPKIIDFGIAKAIDEPIGHAGAAVTEARQMIGTPQYMSPEQAAGAVTVDTRTDIYSLGAMLYELLTGAPPIDVARFRTASFAELQQMIRDRAPARPSTRFSTRTEDVADAAAQRGSDATHLRRLLRGELDWIVMKALEHDPVRRYSSASELAADLQRFLVHEPVIAGPPSPIYRLRKFVRRNRIGVAAAALVTIAIIIGIVGLTSGFVRANRSAREAMAINDFMHDLLRAVDPDRGGADMRVVELLANASEAIPIRFADQPVQQGIVRTYISDSYSALGMLPESLAELERAAELFREHDGPLHPRSLETERLIANNLVRSNRFNEAAVLLADLAPRDMRVHGPDSQQSLQTQRMQALLLNLRGDTDGSIEALRDIIRRVDASLSDDERRWVDARGTLLRVMRSKIGLLDGAERLAAAEEGFQLAREILEMDFAGDGRPARKELSYMTLLARYAFEAGRHTEAIAVSQDVLAETEGRYSVCDPLIDMSFNTLARAHFALRQYDDAARAAQSTIDCVRSLGDGFDAVRLATLADMLPILDAGELFAEGEQYARELTDAFAAVSGHGPGMEHSYRIFLARFISRQGRHEEAEAHFTALFEHEDELLPFRQAQLHLYYGRHLADQGQFEQAEREMMHAAEIVGGVEQGAFDQDPDSILRELIVLYDAWGRAEEAARYRRIFENREPTSSG